jgi:hypothetical protein
MHAWLLLHAWIGDSHRGGPHCCPVVQSGSDVLQRSALNAMVALWMAHMFCTLRQFLITCVNDLHSNTVLYAGVLR